MPMSRIQQSASRLTQVLLIVSLIGWLTACDSGDIEAHNRPSLPLLDEVPANQSSDFVALSLADWTTVSAAGNNVGVNIDYHTQLPAHWFDKSILKLRVQLQPLEDGLPYSVKTIEVPEGYSSGTLSMSVPTSNKPFYIFADIYDPRTDSALAMTRSTAALNIDLLADPMAELSQISHVDAEILTDSYTQQRAGDRMIHRFAVRVYDAEKTVPNRRTIPGLGTEPELYFTALENGRVDVESPITVNATRQRLKVYFVLDASYSIVLAEAQEILKRAASRSVMALHSLADYDYRQFSGDIRALDHIDNILFDDARSATSLYYALDTVMQDIEYHADPLAHKIVIAFTDGRDYASLNRYPNLTTDEAVLQHATELIRTAREREADDGGGLELHIVSVGDADEDALNRLANSGAGMHLSASEWSGVGNAFEEVTRHVLNTYFLEYSSQRTTLPTQLDLQVHVNGAYDSVSVE